MALHTEGSCGTEPKPKGQTSARGQSSRLLGSIDKPDCLQRTGSLRQDIPQREERRAEEGRAGWSAALSSPLLSPGPGGGSSGGRGRAHLLSDPGAIARGADSQLDDAGGHENGHADGRDVLPGVVVELIGSETQHFCQFLHEPAKGKRWNHTVPAFKRETPSQETLLWVGLKVEPEEEPS